MKKLTVAVCAAFTALCTATAARTVSVASVSDGGYNLVFGEADGNAYTLAWCYGSEDGGTVTNAWDTFAVLGPVAADETSRTVALPAGWGETVKAVRFFLLEPETRPYATRLEYIQSDGSQWIDTQVRGRVGVTVEVDVMPTSINDRTFLGSRSDSGNTRFYVIHWANNDMLCGIGSLPGPDKKYYWYWTKKSVVYANTRYSFRCSIENGAQALSINGSVVGTSTYATTFDSGLSMYLFACHYGSNADYKSSAKMYSAKIWLDGELKRDYVPCKDADGTACVYDLVSGSYFYNGGSGTFTAGAEIPLGLSVSSVSAVCNWVSENSLVVEAGSPRSLSSDATYDALFLRDKLTLTGGTLTVPTVTVDGPAGCLEINGGTLPSSTRLALSADMTTENEYATVLALRTGKTVLHCATNVHAGVAARIHFLGGSLGCTSFSGMPLCSVNGGKWILEGTASHAIQFGPLEMQRMYWLTGEGSVETRGPCDVAFIGSGYNAQNDYRSTVYLNVGNTLWNHTGDLVLSNAVDVICRADDCLPAGPQTGGIVMKWVNRAGPPAPRLDLNGYSVAVNGIDGSGGGVVRNSSSTVATLRIGEEDTDGSLDEIVLDGGNIALVKRGSETNAVSIGSSVLASIRVESGTLVVRGGTADFLAAGSVTVEDGATLVIERGVISTGSFSGAGRVEYMDGGKLEITVGDDGSDDTLVWDAPAWPEGNAFVKVGANRAIVQTAETLARDIDVREGTVVFSGRTCTNEWYRFVFNGSAYGQSNPIALGDLRVYPDTAMTEDVAHGIGSNGNVLAAGTSAANLQPGQCVASFATTTTKPSGQTEMNLWDLRNAFDNSAYNAVLSASAFYLYNNASQQSVAFRMAAGKNRVQCYLPVKSYITWYWHPSAWLFQTSADGVNWQTVDTRTGAVSSGGYGSTPFVIKGFLADGAAGFDPAANVKVAAGATLDASGVAGGQTLSRLTVDWTAGAGEIRGVTIAANGVLDLVNVPDDADLREATVPVTLTGVTDGAHFAAWTLRVNGQTVQKFRPRWLDSVLMISGKGFALYFR